MSEAWTIEPLAPPPMETSFEGGVVRLRHQESLVLSFRVTRLKSPSGVSLSAWGLGPDSRQVSHASSVKLRSALACMCLDDMATTFEVRVISSAFWPFLTNRQCVYASYSGRVSSYAGLG
jgi:hypothetical protein